jgi:hypothetical protein
MTINKIFLPPQEDNNNNNNNNKPKTKKQRLVDLCRKFPRD